jgi:hypothetical protein
MGHQDKLTNHFALIAFSGFTLLGMCLQTAVTVDEYKYFDAISENPRFAKGTITKIDYKYNSEDSIKTVKTYELTYEAEGHFHTLSTDLRWLSEEPRTGDQFEIIYNFYRPSMARVHLFSEYRLPLFWQLGGVLIFAGVLFLIWKIRHWVLKLKFSDAWD